MELLQHELTQIRVENEQIQLHNKEICELNSRKAQKTFKIVELITKATTPENEQTQAEYEQWVTGLLSNDADFDDYFNRKEQQIMESLKSQRE